MFGRYNGIKYSGILGEVFEQFKDTFNFTYESVPSIDSFYGSEVSFLLWTDFPLSEAFNTYVYYLIFTAKKSILVPF